MAKLPAFQFYPGDWLKDPALSRVSPAARGVWMDCLCLMFESEQRGKLTTNGKPWTEDELSQSLRGDTAQNRTALAELLDHGVMKKDRNGVLFSSRMVKDESMRLARTNHGKLGAYGRWHGKTDAQPMPNTMPNAMPKHGSSSSSSSSASAGIACAIPCDTASPVAGESETSTTTNQPTSPIPRDPSPVAGLYGPDGSLDVPTPKSRQRPRKARESNPVWDAVAAEFYPSGVPPSHDKKVGRVVADLKALNATPEEIRLRAARYRRAWPDHACTATALVAYWDQFRDDKQPAYRPGRVEAHPGKYDRFKLRPGSSGVFSAGKELPLAAPNASQDEGVGENTRVDSPAA